MKHMDCEFIDGPLAGKTYNVEPQVCDTDCMIYYNGHGGSTMYYRLPGCNKWTINEKA